MGLPHSGTGGRLGVARGDTRLGHALANAAGLDKGGLLRLNLLAQERQRALHEDDQRVGDDRRVGVFEPGVEFRLLAVQVGLVVVQGVIGILKRLKRNAVDGLLVLRVNAPRDRAPAGQKILKITQQLR
jgi:hypothetical protein